ncbi:MAG: DinB family protein [Bacteroidota bacterium]
MSQLAFHLDDAITALTRTPSVVDALLRPLPSDWLDATDGPDTWSARQVVAHLIDGENVDWVVRAQSILAANGDAPTFVPYDVAGSIETFDRSIEDLLDTFAEIRTANVAWLRDAALSETDLNRTGIHPTFGLVTLRQLLATWVAHDHGHMVQITRTLARQYRDEIGPWTDFLSVFDGSR